ncbi:MAG: 50S ribosomal protein L1 [Methanocellales archaeon]|nr:50S ribosomal protein L1 [Methanocellales archaeon]MDD3421395.1 50S ribosomal protein L1 [Methanocellales archaeon]MDD4897764.1 50S ribosomal protein L1 [Methanocellales archaeon]MDD5446600.1 50S ribosomal protein L1 [Methanocellales archaeon]
MAQRDILKAVQKALERPVKRNFTESIDLAINLRNIDMSQPQNRIEEEIVLPNGLGKPVKIAVFASGELAMNAKNAGADLVISPEQIDVLRANKKQAKTLANEHDFFIAEASLMPSIGKSLGPVLGPRGNMPSPISPGSDVTKPIERLRKTVKIRSKDKMTFHTIIGCESMAPEDIAENIETIIKRLETKIDKQKIRSIYMKTTMGPSVRVL